MVRIVFVDSQGRRREVQAQKGSTLMEAAVDNSVEGILAECGGACACGTCHAYVGDPWLSKLDPAAEMEDAMLDAVSARRPNSRLTCQIEVTDQLDGIELTVAGND